MFLLSTVFYLINIHIHILNHSDESTTLPHKLFPWVGVTNSIQICYKNVPISKNHFISYQQIFLDMAEEDCPPLSFLILCFVTAKEFAFLDIHKPGICFDSKRLWNTYALQRSYCMYSDSKTFAWGY